MGDFQAPCDNERNGPYGDACSIVLHEVSFCSQFPFCLSLQIDFTRPHAGETAQVERLEYDPNRSARIALVKYPEGLSPPVNFTWHAFPAIRVLLHMGSHGSCFCTLALSGLDTDCGSCFVCQDFTALTPCSSCRIACRRFQRVFLRAGPARRKPRRPHQYRVLQHNQARQHAAPVGHAYWPRGLIPAMSYSHGL